MSPEDANNIGTAFEYIKGGSLIAFAAAVYYELRQQRNERNQQTKVQNELMSDLRAAMAILLDRAGIKVKRAPTNPVGVPTPPSLKILVDEE